ncbi:unnamed protein product [Protopolystoma xenopodis]|uniref:Uncharacterized protein n=1 Tax=Protopolystoma xenopodis TaxID=117903 RepID=A0A3S5CN10_9PLAT|nr:unnamed protein product [Protopolystoma xenopodis]
MVLRQVHVSSGPDQPTVEEAANEDEEENLQEATSAVVTSTATVELETSHFPSCLPSYDFMPEPLHQNSPPISTPLTLRPCQGTQEDAPSPRLASSSNSADSASSIGSDSQCLSKVTEEDKQKHPAISNHSNEINGPSRQLTGTSTLLRSVSRLNTCASELLPYAGSENQNSVGLDSGISETRGLISAVTGPNLTANSIALTIASGGSTVTLKSVPAAAPKATVKSGAPRGDLLAPSLISSCETISTVPVNKSPVPLCKAQKTREDKGGMGKQGRRRNQHRTEERNETKTSLLARAARRRAPSDGKKIVESYNDTKQTHHQQLLRRHHRRRRDQHDLLSFPLTTGLEFPDRLHSILSSTNRATGWRNKAGENLRADATPTCEEALEQAVDCTPLPFDSHSPVPSRISTSAVRLTPGTSFRKPGVLLPTHCLAATELITSNIPATIHTNSSSLNVSSSTSQSSSRRSRSLSNSSSSRSDSSGSSVTSSSPSASSSPSRSACSSAISGASSAARPSSSLQGAASNSLSRSSCSGSESSLSSTNSTTSSSSLSAPHSGSSSYSDASRSTSLACRSCSPASDPASVLQETPASSSLSSEPSKKKHSSAGAEGDLSLLVRFGLIKRPGTVSSRSGSTPGSGIVHSSKSDRESAASRSMVQTSSARIRSNSSTATNSVGRPNKPQKIFVAETMPAGSLVAKMLSRALEKR